MRPKTHPPIRTGALTLLITLVAVCLAVLSVLSFATARADRDLAQRSLDRFAQDAALENQGQQWLAQLDGMLASGQDGSAAGQLLEDGSIQAVFQQPDGRRLTVIARPTPQGPQRYQIVLWQLGQDWQPDDSLDLWDGTF